VCTDTHVTQNTQPGYNDCHGRVSIKEIHVKENTQPGKNGNLVVQL